MIDINQSIVHCHLGKISPGVDEYESIAIMLIRRNDLDKKIFKCLKYQNERICIEAVSRWPMELKNVWNQTEKICEIAVDGNPFALKHALIQTEDMCIQAMEFRGAALKYVAKGLKTFRVCEAAVKNDGYALQYVDEKTDYLVSLAINQNPMAKRFVVS